MARNDQVEPEGAAGSAVTMSQETLDRLLRLADRIEIEDVICGETMMGDLLDPSVATGKFYTPDATVTFGRLDDPNRMPIPITQYKEMIESLLPDFDFRQHQMTNFIVEIDGDSADCRCMISTHVHIGDDVHHGYGMYHHELVRTPEGWRICRQETDMRIAEGELMKGDSKLAQLATDPTKAESEE